LAGKNRSTFSPSSSKPRFPVNWGLAARLLLGTLLFGSSIVWVLNVQAGSAQGAGATPIWKVEQATIERRVDPLPGHPRIAGQRMVILKLRLRNEGGPGNVPVKIRGRWMTQPPRPFTLLSTYTHEIAFKDTAIVEVQLFPTLLPAGKAMAELSVVTADQETDRYEVEVPE
jgi:hypothetical protein